MQHDVRITAGRWGKFECGRYELQQRLSFHGVFEIFPAGTKADLCLCILPFGSGPSFISCRALVRSSPNVVARPAARSVPLPGAVDCDAEADRLSAPCLPTARTSSRAGHGLDPAHPQALEPGDASGGGGQHPSLLVFEEPVLVRGNRGDRMSNPLPRRFCQPRSPWGARPRTSAPAAPWQAFGAGPCCAAVGKQLALRGASRRSRTWHEGLRRPPARPAPVPSRPTGRAGGASHGREERANAGP